MSHYHHLTIEERERIYLFHGQNITLSEIARRLGRSKSTISRELRRNAQRKTTSKKGRIYRIYYYDYLPSQAQRRYQKRRTNSHKPRLLDDPELRQIVKDKLVNHQWSPEQIANRLELENGYKVISLRTIYRGIYSHLLDEGKYFYPYSPSKIKKYLRHKGKKRRKPGEERRGKFPVEHELDDRPLVADQRDRLGDFEADTVVGTRRGACVMTLVDRKKQIPHWQKITRQKIYQCGEIDVRMSTWTYRPYHYSRQRIRI